MDSGFQATGVNSSGLTALIRNLARDCPPSQYLREFTKNSIEACERTKLTGREVVLDFNDAIYKATGVFKLCLIDNGDGMTAGQMMKLLNNLSSSGTVANQHQNYGVGAKISALTRNYVGIEYESWKNDRGCSILICYNPEKDSFGIQGFADASGEMVYARSLEAHQKPSLIQAHGTRVTLLGMSLDQDTMKPPEGLGNDRSGWLVNYLNNRFFVLPKNIRIQARYAYFEDPSTSENHSLKTISGFQHMADAHSLDRGVLLLEDAQAYWWITKPDSPIRGQTGLVNQGEIFDIQSDRSNRSSYFGIIVGRDRVIIYIEPNNAVQNTARSGLTKPDGSHLNWALWQDEFRENMPASLQVFLDEMLNEASQTSHKESIHQRLNWLTEFYKSFGYTQLQKKSKSKEAPKSKPDDHPPRENNSIANFFPNVEWTNEEKSNQLIGRAAEFLEVSNTVLANLDFQGFQDLLTYFNQKYAEVPDIEIHVRTTVTETLEQALMECVAGVLSFKGKAHWNPGQINSALTKEALTTAVMQRYWLARHIDDELSKKVRAELTV